MNTNPLAPHSDTTVCDFDFQPFGTLLQPLIRKAVQDCDLAKIRKGTKLKPIFLIWLVLLLPIRRDLNLPGVMNWMLSGLRWLIGCLPASARLMSDGAISHARERIGVKVFQRLLLLLQQQHPPLQPDFHGHVTGAFDGSTGTMPDTPSNRKAWGKPGSAHRPAAFPQIRLMCLLIVSVRTIWDVAYAPYRGKQTGERALMQTIVRRLEDVVLLMLLDAGLYSFEMVWMLRHYGHNVIVKVPKTLQLAVSTRLPDGSFLTCIRDSIEVMSAEESPTGRRQWQAESLTVRAMRVQLPGYRPWTLVTTLCDPNIPAREIAQHYHARWDIEIAYDEIKTHQCATLCGHSPTTFRSKRGDFIEQDVYAMVIMYTTIRLLMAQAGEEWDVDPRHLSFLDTLHHLLEAAPLMLVAQPELHVLIIVYLLEVIADGVLDRPRRGRVAPRVVKVAQSRFPRKRDTDRCERRDMEKDLIIVQYPGETSL